MAKKAASAHGPGRKEKIKGCFAFIADELEPVEHALYILIKSNFAALKRDFADTKIKAVIGSLREVAP